MLIEGVCGKKPYTYIVSEVFQIAVCLLEKQMGNLILHLECHLGPYSVHFFN